jgi:hypothetical protein
MSDLPTWMTDAREAWMDDVTGWITGALDSLGLGPQSAVTCVRERIWGAVHRVELPERVLFFKATGPGGRHEPPIVADIAGRWPGLVPDVLAADLDRSWLLMDDHGTPMWDSVDPAGQVAIFERILPHYAEMQRGSRELLGRWIDAGAPDRRVSGLPALLDGLLSGELWRDPLPLDPDERRAIDATVPLFASVCAELGATPFADAVDHSDLHGGNVLVGRGEPRLVDWGDSCITHPFASPFVIYQHAVAKLPASERRVAALRHRDVYLDAWSDDASPDDLRRAFVQAIWIAHVVRALNFAHHLDDTGPDAAEWSRGIAQFLMRWQRHAALLDHPDELIEAVASETEE